MPTTEQYEQFLEMAGIKPTKESVDQLEVMTQALKVHAERTAHYQLGWKQYGGISNLLSMARKVDRLMMRHWGIGKKPEFHKWDLDDAIDLLNYTCFFMRSAEAGSLYGRPPIRPTLDEEPFK